MKVTFHLAEKFVDPFISINAQRESPSLLKLSVAIDRLVNQTTIVGYVENHETTIPLYRILRFYTQDKHVVCETLEGQYQVHRRLYQIRELVEQQDFIAISNAEIINRTAIESFSLTRGGSYSINLTNDTIVYPSRRYLKRIKEALLK